MISVSKKKTTEIVYAYEEAVRWGNLGYYEKARVALMIRDILEEKNDFYLFVHTHLTTASQTKVMLFNMSEAIREEPRKEVWAAGGWRGIQGLLRADGADRAKLTQKLLSEAKKAKAKGRSGLGEVEVRELFRGTPAESKRKRKPAASAAPATRFTPAGVHPSPADEVSRLLAFQEANRLAAMEAEIANLEEENALIRDRLSITEARATDAEAENALLRAENANLAKLREAFEGLRMLTTINPALTNFLSPGVQKLLADSTPMGAAS